VERSDAVTRLSGLTERSRFGSFFPHSSQLDNNTTYISNSPELDSHYTIKFN